MAAQEKSAIELKSLLSSWKSEKLYETFKDEDIFLEELEMMTVEHLDAILKNYKMGVRIRFEHHFKKWRTAIGAPLRDDDTIVEQCSNCLKHNLADKKPPKIIAMPEQETQTESVAKITKIASTQTTLPESTIVTIRHGAEQLREVLNKINKNNPNYQQFKVNKNKPKTELTNSQPAINNASATNKVTVTSDFTIEQPTTTTFHDTTSPPPSSLPLATVTTLRSALFPESNKSLANIAIIRKVPTPVSSYLLPTPADNALPSTSPTTAKLLINAKLKTPPKPPAASPDTTAIKPIIPKASLKRHSTDIKHPVPLNTALHSNLGILRKYGSKGLPPPKKMARKIKSVVDILLLDNNQGYPLLQSYDLNQAFTPDDRKILIELICEYYHKHNLIFSVEVSNSLVDEIISLFPSEKVEYYQKGIHGKIYTQYLNMSHQPGESITLSDSSDPENTEDELNAKEVVINREDGDRKTREDANFDNFKVEISD